MEVFQSCGEEGVLTICLDGAETVRLNFKQKVQVSVSYKSDNGSVNDNPGELKTEAPPPVNDKEKKTDPLDEELNIFIERVKNNEHGNNGLFSNPAGDIFGESVVAGRDVDKTVASTGNRSDIKVCLKNEEETKKRVSTNDNDDCENAMDEDCTNFDDYDNEVGESASVSTKIEPPVVDGVDVKDKGKRDVVRKDSKDDASIIKQNNKSVIDSVLNDDVSECDEDHDVEIISSKGKSVGNAKVNSIAKLVREVAEKKNIIRKTTATAVAPVKGRSLKQKAKIKTILYKCNLCQKRFSDSYLLSIHQRAENTKVMCKKCDLECMSRANLIIHEHLMHSKSGRIAGKMCPVCAMPFGKHSDILSHIRSQHTNEGLYRCCVCCTIFQSYQTFKSHLDFHNKERLKKEAKNNLQRGNQKRELNNTSTDFSRASQSSSGVVKKMPRMNTEPVSSASKRKSQTPMQHRSLMNYQPPAKSANTSKGTPSPQSVRPTVTTRLSNNPSVKPVIKSPAVKVGIKTASKLAVKATPLSISLSKSRASPSLIKKQVLASRLKPLLTPSMLSSRKRPLNQLPGGSLKPASKVSTGRGPLKTLPRVTPQSKTALAKRCLLSPRAPINVADKLWKCHFCERVFRTKGEYINHKKPSRITQMCKQCGFTSTSKALYMIHDYQKHTNKGNDRYTVVNEDLRCHICEDPIALNEVLNHVMSKHTGEHPYECCVCKKPSKAYEDWVSHGKSHVRSKEEKSSLITRRLVLNLTVKTEETQKSNEMFCNLCKQYYSNEKEFIRHHKSETKKIECEICRTVCFTEAGYLVHRYITHGLSAGQNNEDSTNLPSSSFSDNANDKIWHEDDVINDNNLDSTKCPNCLEFFPLKDLLSHVMTVHTQESPYKCCTCKATLSNLDQYIEHCDFHLGRKLYSRGTQRCLVCGLRFESRIRLSRHKVMHKPSCPYCHVEFNSKALLDVHLKNFHMKDMTPCGFCGKLFAESNQLAEHERNHFFYKKSPCPVCGLTVTNVNKHVARVHPKPDTHFLCNLCGQKFPLKCDLSRHMSKHSNDRKHECDICKKTFKRAAGLRRHAQSHLQNRKFHECHICGKKCSQRNNLSVHMRVHSATKAFTCEHCGQGFNYNQSLQTHIRKKHTEEPPVTPATKMITPAQEPTDPNTRRLKQEPTVLEPISQMVNNVNSTQQNNIVGAPLVNYQEHPITAAMYQPAESSQHYYPDPSGYVPVNAVAFHRSYNDLINTIVRSEHDNNNNNNNNNPPPSGVPQQNYPMYYPQF